MSKLDDADNNIHKKRYNNALEDLHREKKSLRRDYLYAKIYYELDEKKKAYNLLLQLYFNPEFNFSIKKTFRKEVIDLIEKVSKDFDIETYDAINSKENNQSNSNIDIIRKIYFGGAKYRLSMSEIVTENKCRITEKLITDKTILKGDYFIQFCKNYSSFTPLLKSSDKISIGGGYFLNLDGYGLVIDPGHNFLDNFYLARRSFDDINGIVVTHFHDDHYADLPSLLALIFQCSKDNNLNKKKYDLFFDGETYDKFKDFFNNEKVRNYGQKVRLSSQQEMIVEIKNRIYLKPLKTNHATFVKNSGVGILININEKSTQVFITGDTGWNKRIENDYKKQIIEGWERILVAHISTLYNQEAISFIKGNAVFYKNHLCIHGLLNSIECINPNVIILSEIGEELAPIIHNLAKIIEDKYGIPCHVGMNEFVCRIN